MSLLLIYVSVVCLRDRPLAFIIVGHVGCLALLDSRSSATCAPLLEPSTLGPLNDGSSSDLSRPRRYRLGALIELDVGFRD